MTILNSFICSRHAACAQEGTVSIKPGDSVENSSRALMAVPCGDNGGASLADAVPQSCD